MGWTEERVSELKKLWAEGHSASQIAKKLGAVTRNAVIGKVHRLGLSGPAHTQITAAEANVEPQRLPNGDMVTVLTVKDSMCKWPIGDPADANFGFCGHGTAEGSPYCAEHARVAFQPAKKRERRAREFDYIQRLAG
jgi:GcrA cell cycle regulator